MAKSSNGTRLFLFALLVAGAVVAAGCHTGARLPLSPMDSYDTPLILNLEAASATSGPYLSTNPDSSTADHYVAISDATVGLKTVTTTVTGGAGLVFQFPVQPALARDYYLNVSKAVEGMLYWQSAVSEKGSRGSAHFRLEVYLGSEFVGGDEYTFNSVEDGRPWMPLPFGFRSEVHTLAKGAVLTLKIIHNGGLADLKIGTGSDHQSYLEFRYYDVDPFAGAIYIENGKMITAPSSVADDAFFARAQALARQDGPGGIYFLAEEGQGDATQEAAVAAAAASIPALGLLSLSGGRRKIHVLVGALLIMVAVSGCFGGGEAVPKADDGSLAPPTVTTSYQGNVSLEERGIGAIQGLVRNEESLPVADARVSILGTRLTERTDAGGRFEFGNMSARVYSLRFEADSYEPIEEQVEVQVGKIAIIEVTLPSIGSGNRRQHTHGDLWGDATSLPIQSVEVTLNSCATGFLVDTKATGTSVFDTMIHCKTPVPIDISHVVPPGTSVVEVMMDWASSGSSPKQLGISVTTATNKTESFFLPRAAKTPFRIAMFPLEADPGHQKFTTWSFQITNPITDGFFPTGPLIHTMSGKVRFSVVAYKGVIPFEPAHRDFWGGMTELTIFNKKTLTSTNTLIDYPNKDTNLRFVPGKDVFIPPGTKELRGTLKYSNTYVSSGQTEWKLVYKGANRPDSDFTWKPIAGQTSGTTFTFSFAPLAEEFDQFYQYQSNWAFMPDDGQAPIDIYSVNTGYGTTWELSIVAVKDPSYQDA